MKEEQEMTDLMAGSLPVPMEPAGELTENLIQQPSEQQGREEENFEGSEPSNGQCRDPIFGFLFLGHVLAVAVLGIIWGVPSLDYDSIYPGGDDNSSGDDEVDVSFVGLLILVLVAGVGSIVISALALTLMARFPTILIQMSILFNTLASIFIVAMCLWQGNAGGALVAFIVFAAGCCYACLIWRRIPFAAANLKTGLTAVRTNIGVSFISILMAVSGWVFGVFWLLAIFGTYIKMGQPTCTEEEGCDSSINGGIATVFLFSLFWTQQVITNVVHVTVAGVVGTWWFVPQDASSACSKSIGDSFFRATTTSFGSICLGSLLVALIQTFYSAIHSARQNGRGNSILLCVLECVLRMIESLVEYFNKWAFIYVGLYGDSYIEAGKKVMTLFKARGWSNIINDSLVSRVLAWMSLAIGGLNGLAGIIAVKIAPTMLSGIPPDAHAWIAFTCGFLIGVVVAAILMGLIASAVDTVIVCFAEVPDIFRTNYPELSQEMEEAWHAIYPAEYPAAATQPLATTFV